MISKLWVNSTKIFKVEEITENNIRTTKIYNNNVLLFSMKSRYWKDLDEKYLSIDILFISDDNLISELLKKVNKTITTFTEKYVNETTIECLCGNKQLLDEHFDFNIIKE